MMKTVETIYISNEENHGREKTSSHSERFIQQKRISKYVSYLGSASELLLTSMNRVQI
jgi:hypothetical protein